LNIPFGIAFDASGNLYVANPGITTIHEFGPTGADLGVFVNTGGGANTPLYIAFSTVPEPATYLLFGFGAVGLTAVVIARGLRQQGGRVTPLCQGVGVFRE
jgi:hypothetical protein